jgi:NAD(P)-dependent dehydrogenase (short-subunit alcohol dehydrogenase family)
MVFGLSHFCGYLLPSDPRLIMLHGQIRVNCVALGAVHTELINIMSAVSLPEGSGPEASEKKLQGILSLFKSKTLTGTVGQPEDVADMVDAGSIRDGDMRA